MVEFDRFRGLFAVFIHFQDDYCLFFQNKMSKCKSILYKDDQNYQKTGQRNQVQVRNSRDDTCHRSSDIYHATIIKHSQDLNVDISGALLTLGFVNIKVLSMFIWYFRSPQTRSCFTTQAICTCIQPWKTSFKLHANSYGLILNIWIKYFIKLAVICAWKVFLIM